MQDYDSQNIRRLDPAYLGHYGLHQAPFSTVHDDSFLYIDAERAQRLDMLTHLTQYSNLLLIVSGERGVGKTSMLQRFVKNADEAWRICEVSAHTMMDSATMLSEIGKNFGLTALPHDPAAIEEIVFEHLKALQNEDLIPILVIDDAHELPKDALETLFYFADIEAAQGHLLRIILFCEPQIDIMLESPSIRPLRERITHTTDILPFNEEQTAEYIKHRMAVAGFEGTSPFTPKVISKIHKIARGIPSHINELAHLHLDDSANMNTLPPDPVPDKNTEERAFNTRHIVFASIVLIVIAVVLVMQDDINQTVEVPAPQTITKVDPQPAVEKSTIKELTLKQPPAQPLYGNKKIADNSQQTTTSTTNDHVIDRTPAVTTETAAQTSTSEIITTTDKAGPAASNKLLLTQVSPNPVNSSREPQTITLKGQGFKQMKSKPEVLVSWTGKTKQLKPQQYKIIDNNTIEISITVGSKPDTWSAQVKSGPQTSDTIAFKVVASKPKPTQNTQLQGTLNEQWILEQEPNRLTLQLLGTRNKVSIKKFIQRYRLLNNTAVYRTLRNGKPWYALLYGSYENKTDAQTARKVLLKNLGSTKPWLRRFDSVQAQINTEKPIRRPVKPKALVKARTKTGASTITSSLTRDINGNPDAWLWSQDPRYYTLQLLGGRNDKNIKQFIAANKLRGKTITFNTRHNQRQWYAVVYGVYPSRNAAMKALKQLPASLQKISPWVRSFASIHKDLHQSE